MSYQEKKAFFDRVITVYGRNAVLEALNDYSLDCYRLHLASSNKPAKVLDHILELATKRGITPVYHDKKALSRISKNARQDQGIAADILCPEFQTLEDYLSKGSHDNFRLLAMDEVTNPANMGMIIRSAVAADIDGILWCKKGNPALGPLVIKASAGTIYRAPLVLTDTLAPSLAKLKSCGYRIVTLDANAQHRLGEKPYEESRIFVLGNESNGVSREVAALADHSIAIPMANQVESLNVAVAAALIAYLDK